MLLPLLIILAVVFLVLGFAGALGLITAVALAVVCIVLALVFGSGRVGFRL